MSAGPRRTAALGGPNWPWSPSTMGTLLAQSWSRLRRRVSQAGRGLGGAGRRARSPWLVEVTTMGALGRYLPVPVLANGSWGRGCGARPATPRTPSLRTRPPRLAASAGTRRGNRPLEGRRRFRHHCTQWPPGTRPAGGPLSVPRPSPSSRRDRPCDHGRSWAPAGSAGVGGERVGVSGGPVPSRPHHLAREMKEPWEGQGVESQQPSEW